MTVPCHLSSNNCAPVPSVNVHVELQNEGLVTMKVPRGPLVLRHAALTAVLLSG